MKSDNLFHFSWEMIYSPLQTMDIFYCDGYGHNPVLFIEYRGKRVMISCDGEMKFDYNDTRIRNCDDLIHAGITTDNEWYKAANSIENGYFPWFDAYIEENNNWVHLDMVNGSLDDIILQCQRYLMEATKQFQIDEQEEN